MTRLRLWMRYLLKARETWRVLALDFGWKRAFMEKRPIDANGAAIPWYTYPAIEFLRSLDLRDKRVFEFGCGNSSVFWAGMVRELVAVENDPAWAGIVRNFGIRNLTLIEESDRERYIASPERVGGGFDIVVIDGRFRHACVASACRVAKRDGMIIFDNADWYPEACAELREKGWFQIDFSGFGPINPYCWTTSVFIRSELRAGRTETFRPTGGTPPRRDGSVGLPFQD